MDTHSTGPAKLIQWNNEFTATPDGHQEWAIIRKSTKHYVLQNKKSGLFMTVNNHAMGPDDIIQWNDEFAGKIATKSGFLS